MRNIKLAAAFAAIALIIVQFVGMASASAHTTAITGVATCDTATGTYNIVWTGHTDQVPSNDVGKVTETVPHNAVITETLAPNADYSFTSTADGDATYAPAAVHIDWTGGDTFSADASGHVNLDGGCVQVVEPTPSLSTSDTPSPSPSTTASTSASVYPPSQPSSSPSTSASSSFSIAPPVSTHRAVVRSSTPVAHSQPLASTGSKTGTMIGIAVVLLVGGVAFLFLGNRYLGTHRADRH